MNSGSLTYNGSYGPGAVEARNAAAIRLFKFLENAVVLLLILQFSGALIALLLTDPNDLESESPLARLLWYPGYILILLLCLRHLPRLVRMAIFNPLIVICVLWCGISYFWSIEPSVTMRRSVALLMTTTFGLFLAARYDWNGLIQRLALAYAILALISVFLAIGVPELGRMQQIHEGAWRGAWLEKNSFGLGMAKALLLDDVCLCHDAETWLDLGSNRYFVFCLSFAFHVKSSALVSAICPVRIFRHSYFPPLSSAPDPVDVRRCYFDQYDDIFIDFSDRRHV